MEKFPAVILAGGAFRQRFFWREKTPKCFKEVGGAPLVAYAVAAARHSPLVNSVTLVAELNECLLGKNCFRQFVDRFVEPGATIIGSMRAGSKNLGPDEPTLYLCGDMPKVTAEMVTRVVEVCQRKPEADAWYIYCSQANASRAMPAFPHTYAQLAEGTFCGTGVGILRPKVLASPIIGALEESRKSVLGLLGQLGSNFVFRYFFGPKPTLGELEARMSEIFGYRFIGLEALDGELTIDIDTPKKLELVQLAPAS
ncbi:nucleotidyltransferase family protein [Candidatus Berkelbacteria bacterium]|nr:nucleotidyltransferase family protein [Candidatus Berkelbacteria bacterium]